MQQNTQKSSSSPSIQDLKFHRSSFNLSPSNINISHLQNRLKSKLHPQNPSIFTIFQLVFRNDISGLRQFLSNSCKSQKELKSILLKRIPCRSVGWKEASSRSTPTDLAFSSSVSSDLDLPPAALLPLISPGHTLLLQAIALRKLEMVNLILSFANGTSINAPDLESGYSPLQKALGAGELFIAMSLLENSNINLDSKDNEGLDWIDYFFETISLPKLDGCLLVQHHLHKDTPLLHQKTSSSRVTVDDQDIHLGQDEQDDESRSSTSSNLDGLADISIDDTLQFSLQQDTCRRKSSRRLIVHGERDYEFDTDNDQEQEKDKATTADYSFFTKHSVSMSLWTWGSNHNHLLGNGGESDSRPTPQLLHPLPTPTLSSSSSSFSSFIRSQDSRIRYLCMSKYHAVLVLQQDDPGPFAKPQTRVYTYGVGLGGRLGHADESSKRTPTLLDVFGSGRGGGGSGDDGGEKRIVIGDVAVGDDHSLVVEEGGYGRVWGWGWNRYGQVGVGGGVEKVMEPMELPALKRVTVKGVAASKYHSAAFTSEGALYTWGTNYGALGYDTNVQSTPKKVIAFSPQPILGLSATPTATLILSKSAATLHNNVYVIMNNSISRLSMPLFPATKFSFSPASSATARHHPVPLKLSSGGPNQVGIVMSNGDVCVWSATTNLTDSDIHIHHQPQISVNSTSHCKVYWRARKKHNIAIDCAIGADGGLLIVTERGHVYHGVPRYHPRSSISSLTSPLSMLHGTTPPSPVITPVSPYLQPYTTGDQQQHQPSSLKFTKISGLEHISSVSASRSGCFAAIRSDYRRPPDTFLPSMIPFSLDLSSAPRYYSSTEMTVNGVAVDTVVLCARSLFALKLLSDSPSFQKSAGDGWTLDVCKQDRATRFSLIILRDGCMVDEKIVELVVQWMYCRRITLPWPFNYRLQRRVAMGSTPPSASALAAQADFKKLYCDFKRLVDLLKLNVDESELDYIRGESNPEECQSDSDNRIPSSPLSSSSRGGKLLPPSAAFLEKLSSLDQLANVSVETSNGIVECHQIILSTRSGFFNGFFRGDWKLGYTCRGLKRISLPQTTRAIFKQLYRHLLHPCTDLLSPDFADAGRKDDWMDSIKQLQILADELIVPHLVHLCSIVLGRFLTLQNVFVLLEHALNLGVGSKVMGLDTKTAALSVPSSADTPVKKKKELKGKPQYHSNHLSESCIDFIIRNLETFLKKKVLQSAPTILVQAVQDRIKYLQTKKLPFLLGPDGYYTKLAALEEAQKKEQKEERRMRYAAENGVGDFGSSSRTTRNNGRKEKNMGRQLSNESFLTITGSSSQLMQIPASPGVASDSELVVSEAEDQASPLIGPVESPLLDPVSRLFSPPHRSTSAMSFSTAVLSPMMNGGSYESSPVLRQPGTSVNVASSMEDFKLDSDEPWMEARRKNSSKRSSIDQSFRKPPVGSVSGSPAGYSSAASYENSAAVSPSHFASTPNDHSPFISSSASSSVVARSIGGTGSASAETSPFSARLSSAAHDIQSHRFLGSGIKLVRQLSTSIVIKDPFSPLTSTPAKSQLSAKLSGPLKPVLSLAHSPLQASPTHQNHSSPHQTTPDKGVVYGIQIKTATKLSQRERKRLSSQNLTASSANAKSAPNSAASTPASSAWGNQATAPTSAASSAAKISLQEIQQQEEARLSKSQFPPSFSFTPTPTKTTRWSMPTAAILLEKTPLSGGNKSTSTTLRERASSSAQPLPECRDQGPSSNCKSFTSSPVVSLLNIQQQQTRDKLAMQKVKSKTIAQIQAEECAIRELTQFYKDTKAPDSGEWFTLERKTTCK